jgi:hypothetical protein
VLLIGRGSALARSGGSHLSLGKGFDLVMLLKPRWMSKGPMGPH